MTSRVRIRSSRANGALSRGPKTKEGKLRSAGNRCTHGLYSHRVVLKNESQEEFDAALQQYIDQMQPQNGLELSAIRVIAAARWCIRRIQATETRMLNDAIDALDPAISDPLDRITQAFSALMEDPAFKLLPRVEDRYSRQYDKAFQMILDSRTRSRKLLAVEIPQKIQNEAQNPLNDSLITESAAPKSDAHPSPETKNEASTPLYETLITPDHTAGPAQNHPNQIPTPPSPTRSSGWPTCRRRQAAPDMATRVHLKPFP